jgi:hypothetical protein
MMIVLIVLTGCSSKTPPNSWEYKSSHFFSTYTQHLLRGEATSARVALKKSIHYAKQSADLKQLARIYLGRCALHISMGGNGPCKQYEQIQELVHSKELQAYDRMLQHRIVKEEIPYLPKQYQRVMYLKLTGQKDQLFETIRTIPQITSRFITAHLMQEELSAKQINYLIKTASFYGYKLWVIHWLKRLKAIESSLVEKEKIEKKIKLLIE